MGLFNKTEEEKKLEEENKKIRYLINTIRENYDISTETTTYLVDYIENIRKGKPNDFEDIDTLTEIILKMVCTSFHSLEDMKKQLESTITLYKRLIPKGDTQAKDKFINEFVGENGLIHSGLFDETLFALFYNKEDYFEVMNVIKSSSTAKENFDLVKSYISKVCKYCLNQDILKRDIISFVSGLEDVVDRDYNKYSEESLENAKRRIGVYNLSPKQLAECDSKLRKMGDYLEQFDIFQTNLAGEKEQIVEIISSGKKEIREAKNKSVDELKRQIELQKKELMKKLDQYLQELEDILKDKSDATFRQIIETYKSQVEDFRRIFRTYSSAASKDLLEIQKATEASVRKLEDYVTNEPQLRDLLSKAQEQNAVRDKIVELVTKEQELLEKVPEAKTSGGPQVVIPGYDRIMVPYKHLILPEEVTKKILPALDSSIPFDIRLEKVEEQMKMREANGEIFHKKLKNIVVDLMEGDWPYLWGPSGTGKSYMAKQAASLLGMNFTKAGKITEPHSVIGYNDPQGRFRITPTFVAALYGYLLSLDEFDNGNPDTQVVLNDIYSELLNKLENPSEPCEVTFGTDVQVDIHPNFRMISTGNTSGSGENSVYTSRGQIDESIQERMTPIYIDYDNRVEERILSDFPAWYKFIVDFRNACIKYADSNGIEAAQGITTTRDAAAIRKYVKNNSKSIEQIIEEKFIQTKDPEYLKALGRTIASIYNLDYGNCKNPNFTGTLKDADEKVLAKKFISACKKGIN